MTLRCACEDFDKDWIEANDLRMVRELRAAIAAQDPDNPRDSELATILRMIPPLAQLRHPLILAFDDKFSSADDTGALRESISSVTDRPWWKQKFSARWRGAATVLTAGELETAWLCAAGYHREGSPEDFYTWFARECAGGSEGFMPSGEDRVLERVDRKISDLDAWTIQLHLSSIILLCNALDNGAAGPMTVTKPGVDAESLMDLSVVAEVVEEAGEKLTEVTVFISPLSRESNATNSLATRTILAAIDPLAEHWRTAPLAGMKMSHALLLSGDAEVRAREIRDRGELSAEDFPGRVRLGSVSHYARATQLTDATVEGEPVQAICGYWFVPMHDHEGLEVCPTCAAAHQALPE